MYNVNVTVNNFFKLSILSTTMFWKVNNFIFSDNPKLLTNFDLVDFRK